MKVMLEDDALVGAVYLAERSNANYLHRIDACYLDVTTVEDELNLVRSTIPIPFSGERERSVGNRDTNENERRIRRGARKGGNLSNKCDRTGRRQQPDLPIELTYIRRGSSCRREYPRIRLGIDL